MMKLILSILALKQPKNTFSYLNFGPAEDKNAIEAHFQAILRTQRVWEALSQISQNFWGSFGSQG